MTELKVLKRRSTGSEKHGCAEKFLKVVSLDSEWRRYDKFRRRDTDVTKIKLSFQEILGTLIHIGNQTTASS